MKPRILVSTVMDSKCKNYTDAIECAGGIAIAEYAPKINLNYDGLLLCGGSDVNPKYYNRKICGSVNMDDIRDKAEFELVNAYIKARKPIFGICRGFQLINIAFGGTLFQDMLTAHLHTALNGTDQLHQVTSLNGSIVYNLFEKNFVTNSAHHQSVNKLGKGLIATVWSENKKVIEGLEHNDLPIFGVQWHPERMCCGNFKKDTVDALPIFRYFINLCNKSAK